MSATTAADAGEALRLLSAASAVGRPYGLALIDFDMPDINGAELAAAVRTTAPRSSIRLLILTASGSGRHVAADAGIDGFLAKPVRSARLVEEIAAALRIGRAAEPYPLAAATLPDRCHRSALASAVAGRASRVVSTKAAGAPTRNPNMMTRHRSSSVRGSAGVRTVVGLSRVVSMTSC